jgi:SET domain-containing protein
MRMTQSEKKNLTVAKSRNGLGIFALRDFVKEEVVFEVRGSLLTCNEDDVVDEQTRSNTFRYDDDLYLSPAGTVGDFLNHSCNPNAKVAKEGKKLFIRAIKTISKNKEVLIDYSTIIASDDSWTMKCNCGSTKCRGVIKKFRLLPSALREKYISNKMVPQHILEN